MPASGMKSGQKLSVFPPLVAALGGYTQDLTQKSWHRTWNLAVRAKIFSQLGQGSTLHSGAIPAPRQMAERGNQDPAPPPNPWRLPALEPCREQQHFLRTFLRGDAPEVPSDYCLSRKAGNPTEPPSTIPYSTFVGAPPPTALTTQPDAAPVYPSKKFCASAIGVNPKPSNMRPAGPIAYRRSTLAQRGTLLHPLPPYPWMLHDSGSLRAARTCPWDKPQPGHGFSVNATSSPS